MERHVVHIVWHLGHERASLSCEVWQNDQRVQMVVQEVTKGHPAWEAVRAEHEAIFPTLFP